MSLRRPGILFYEEDLVALKSDAGQRVATVVRTWHEDGEIDNDDELDLAENQYLVEWINKRRQTVNGHDLILRDRSFQVGDICRSTTQAQKNTISGVVANVKMEVQLQSVATATKTPDWISTTTLSKTACIEEGDHVIYKNWVGIVEIVFEEALLTVKGSNRPYKVYCVEGVQYGSPSETILDSMQGIVTGKSLGSHITRGNSKVVAIRQTVVFVTWLALNQKVSRQNEKPDCSC
jgi:co-chaperonin GroES (HSP10)